MRASRTRPTTCGAFHSTQKTVVGVAISPTSRCTRHQSEEQKVIDATCRLLHSACDRIAPTAQVFASLTRTGVFLVRWCRSGVMQRREHVQTEYACGFKKWDWVECVNENGKCRLAVEQRQAHAARNRGDAALQTIAVTVGSDRTDKQRVCRHNMRERRDWTTRARPVDSAKRWHLQLQRGTKATEVIAQLLARKPVAPSRSG